MWDFNEMNVAAAHGAKMPANLTAPEQCCFMSLRSLYAAYNRGAVTKSQAVKEKNEIIQQYRVWSNAYTQHWNDCVEIQARNHVSAEWLAKIHKSLAAGKRDVEALGQACYCLGLMLQDRPLADLAARILSEEVPKHD